MADILRFEKPQAEPNTVSERAPQWRPVKSDPFAVHRGELITRFRCERCGKEKTKAT